MSQTSLRAVAFDLYGTLMSLDNPLLHREVPLLFGVPPRRWLALVRSTLLQQSFPSIEAMTQVIAQQLGRPELAARCQELLEREVASTRLLPGVHATLKFLARRGFKLGLISNLSAAHVSPLAATGLAKLFDATVLSCRDGIAKPQPEAFRLLCERLDLPPEEVLMVGDSLINDVRAAAAAGLRTVRIGEGEESEEVASSVAMLGWRRLGGPKALAPLLAPGMEINAPDGQVRVHRLQPVGDSQQGRYNLVCQVTARQPGSMDDRTFFAKRYLDPASAPVELLGYRLQALCGLPACRAGLHGDEEPILLVSAAPGQPLAGPITPPVAFEIGRQFAFGYVFANADLRPRNMFLNAAAASPRLTAIDLEHLFLNLAIDVEQLPNPSNPYAIDAVPPTRLHAQVKRRVLSPRTLPRARAEFFDARTVGEAVTAAFQGGFLAQWEILQERRTALLELLHQAAYTPPYLLVGTRAYRRAMATIDLEDIAHRLAEDPHRVLAQLLAVR